MSRRTKILLRLNIGFHFFCDKSCNWVIPFRFIASAVHSTQFERCWRIRQLTREWTARNWICWSDPSLFCSWFCYLYTAKFKIFLYAFLKTFYVGWMNWWLNGIVLLFLDHDSRRRGGVSLTPRPHFTSGKDPVPIIQEAGWAPGPVWTGAENLAHIGIRSSDRPARSQSLYWLSYQVHSCKKGNKIHI